jgi:hypothetical protein
MDADEVAVVDAVELLDTFRRGEYHLKQAETHAKLTKSSAWKRFAGRPLEETAAPRTGKLPPRLAPNVKRLSFAVCRSARTYESKNTTCPALTFHTMLKKEAPEVKLTLV